MIMINLIFQMILASSLFIAFYFISYYGAFDVCLSDDVEFRYGKRRIRNRRKNVSGWWHKFLFLDIKKEVIHWHYIMFWANLVSSIVAIISLNAYIIYNEKIINIVFLASEGTALFATCIILSVRWGLYAGNKVRSRKRYRK